MLGSSTLACDDYFQHAAGEWADSTYKSMGTGVITCQTSLECVAL